MNAPAVAQPAPVLFKTYCAALAYGTVFAYAWVALPHGERIGRVCLPLERREQPVICSRSAWEWLLFALAAWGIRLGGVSIQSVIGGRWSRPIDFLRDLGIGVRFLIASNILLAGLQAILRPGPNANIGRMLPRTATEITLWIFLSLSAGICEEFTIRGYLQKQLSGWLKNEQRPW